MARTYKTLSLSMPPGVVEELAMLGKPTNRVAARVAADIVLREVATSAMKPKEALRGGMGGTRQRSWCCHARVIPVQGQLVLPDERWMPAVVLLCVSCKKQLHGREYEGWIDDV
jgi:hypothetical protein